MLYVRHIRSIGKMSRKTFTKPFYQDMVALAIYLKAMLNTTRDPFI